MKVDRGKEIKTLKGVRPVENKRKNLQSVLEISAIQKKVKLQNHVPSYNLQDHAYE